VVDLDECQIANALGEQVRMSALPCRLRKIAAALAADFFARASALSIAP
jgi:hypothetical protein